MEIWIENDVKFCLKNNITECDNCGAEFTVDDVVKGIYRATKGDDHLNYYICRKCYRQINPNPDTEYV